METLQILWLVLSGLLGMNTGGVNYTQYLDNPEVTSSINCPVTQNRCTQDELKLQLQQVEAALETKPVFKDGGGIDWIGAN